MIKAFEKFSFNEYKETTVAGTLRAHNGGDVGGGSETLIIDALVFNEGVRDDCNAKALFQCDRDRNRHFTDH